jgi:hypothetical protein
MESIYPILWRHVGLEKECADDIISGADGTFSFSILRRCVWVGKTICNIVH